VNRPSQIGDSKCKIIMRYSAVFDLRSAGDLPWIERIPAVLPIGL
jgi:hypothetical protein